MIKMKVINKKKLYYLLFVVLAVLMLVAELLNMRLAYNSIEYDLVYNIITRAIGATMCMILMSYCSFTRLFSSFGKLKNILLVLPCCLIAINNFPFIPMATGALKLDTKWYLILLFALQCLLVGMFEETAFRGCVFMLLLEKKHNTIKDVFYSIVMSSFIFGAIHIVNLFVGAGIVSVVLQLGYSFLIGSMCAVVLLVTKKIWLPIFIHAVFNFAGGLVPTLGVGEIWDTPTIILTVIVSVAVAVYTVTLFFKRGVSDAEELLKK